MLGGDLVDCVGVVYGGGDHRGDCGVSADAGGAEGGFGKVYSYHVLGGVYIVLGSGGIWWVVHGLAFGRGEGKILLLQAR